MSRDDGGGMMGRRRFDACAVHSVAALALAARWRHGVMELAGGRGRRGSGGSGGSWARQRLRPARHDVTSSANAVESRHHAATTHTRLHADTSEWSKWYSSLLETRLRATKRHLPYGITQCCLPPD